MFNKKKVLVILSLFLIGFLFNSCGAKIKESPFVLCKADSDCTTSNICKVGKCSLGFCVEEDKAKDSVCGDNKVCYTGSCLEKGATCSKDEDCVDSLACTEDICTNSYCLNIPHIISETEDCDLVDDNCDGYLHKNSDGTIISRVTSCGYGACSGNKGIQYCQADGTWSADTCDWSKGLSKEDCRSDLDLNCNSKIALEDSYCNPFGLALWDNKTNDIIHGNIIFLEANPRICTNDDSNCKHLEKNDYLATFYIDHEGKKKNGGSNFWNASYNIGFPSFGNDNSTNPIKDGFAFAEVMEYRIFSNTTKKDYIAQTVNYTLDSLTQEKWYPLGLSRINNYKAIVNFDAYADFNNNIISKGSELDLEAKIFIAGSGDYSYNWYELVEEEYILLSTNITHTVSPSDTSFYKLVVKDNATNQESEHKFKIIVKEDPILNLEEETKICRTSNTYTVENTVAKDYSKIEWYSSSKGEFLNKNILNPTYKISELDKTKGSVVLYAVLEPLDGVFKRVQDYKKVYISKDVSISFENDTEIICANKDDELEISARVNNYEEGSIVWSKDQGSGQIIGSTNLKTVKYKVGEYESSGIILKICADSKDPCTNQVCKNKNISILPAPTVNNPNTRKRCENQNIPINGVASNYSKIEWTSSGNGIFDNKDVFSTNYNLGSSDIINGQVYLTLTAYTNAQCSNQNITASKAIDVTVIKLPSASLSSHTNNQTINLVTGNTIEISANFLNTSSKSWSVVSQNGVIQGELDGESITYKPSSSGKHDFKITLNSISPCNEIRYFEFSLNINLN